jgi:hypothetical protein
MESGGFGSTREILRGRCRRRTWRLRSERLTPVIGETWSRSWRRSLRRWSGIRGLAALLEGEATVYRGSEGVRELFQGYFEAFADLRFEVSEIRDLGDRILAVGQMRGRGAESGVEIESPWAYLIQVTNGKATHVRTYLDPKEALEAAGLLE